MMVTSPPLLPHNCGALRGQFGTSLRRSGDEIVFHLNTIEDLYRPPKEPTTYSRQLAAVVPWFSASSLDPHLRDLYRQHVVACA
jgi:hypothetical protein